MLEEGASLDDSAAMSQANGLRLPKLRTLVGESSFSCLSGALGFGAQDTSRSPTNRFLRFGGASSLMILGRETALSRVCRRAFGVVSSKRGLGESGEVQLGVRGASGEKERNDEATEETGVRGGEGRRMAAGQLVSVLRARKYASASGKRTGRVEAMSPTPGPSEKEMRTAERRRSRARHLHSCTMIEQNSKQARASRAPLQSLCHVEQRRAQRVVEKRWTRRTSVADVKRVTKA